MKEKIDIIASCLKTELFRDFSADELRELLPEVHLISIHTPSFKGSQVTGYDVALEAFLQTLAKKDTPNGKLNLITGWVNPGDVTALKHLLAEMKVEATVLFEIESFDSPLMPDKSGIVKLSWSFVRLCRLLINIRFWHNR